MCQKRFIGEVSKTCNVHNVLLEGGVWREKGEKKRNIYTIMMISVQQVSIKVEIRDGITEVHQVNRGKQKNLILVSFFLSLFHSIRSKQP